MSEPATFSSPQNFRLAVVLTIALTYLRVGLLLFTPLDLHGDEAQYWHWSRTLDWGYFSKPPLIAWTIAASTALFGNDEWAVRLFAPIAHGLGALALFFLGQRLYHARAGLWAAIGWLLMPGVQVSSAIISTDALLLPLWAASLLCLWRLMETRSWRWAAALGVALGAGILAKYAMLYFLLGAGLAALTIPRLRAALASANGALAGAVALAIVAPNLVWNATHGFSTIAHTASNAALGGSLFHPDQLLSFIVDQFGVFGPLAFGALLFWLLPRAARKPGAMSEPDRFLLAFIVPPLAIIAVQALLSRANANWAAAAYPAAIVWLAGRFSAGHGQGLLGASAALHGVLAGLLAAALVSPAFADRIGLANGLKRARGWEQTAALIAQRVRADGQITAIAVDNRLMFYDLSYYWRDAPPPAPLRMWLLEGKAGNSAEQSAPLAPPESGRVLVVLMTAPHKPFVFDDFVHAVDAGTVSVPLGGGKRRDLTFALATALSPAPRDAAFYVRLRALRGEE